MAKNKLPAADVTEDPHYHDTWTLLRKYRDVVWSLEVSVRQVRNRFRIDYGKTIEDFLESVYLAGADLSGTELEHQAKCIEQSHTQKKTYASTTEAFLTALSRIGEQSADIRFDSWRSFYHPPRVRKQSKFDKLKQFYVLKAWSGYFVKRTRHGVMTIRTDDPTIPTVRKFRTEKAAQKYMEENAPFFSRVPFSVECVQPKEAAKAA